MSGNSPALGEESPRPERDELIAQYIETQKQEIALKAQSLEFEKQKDSHSFAYSKEALAAQERDRKDERDCKRQQRRDAHRFLLWIATVIALLIGAALYLDKEDVAMELVKAIVYIAAGAAAGYGIASKRAEKDDDPAGSS
ncbi:hypothetical protein [Marilutibacter aestuarii]|uniref:DUF2335 domain-containing protein n=1 Tax=Marilutibacter aestuarii TaxID=1706195 RepID=A0A508A1R3_9GAMM|nr:hypothetical protein [Lysobacter aestuarii]TQD42364.1 hypothetical protein FKV25_11815 [Lysobacter aestuarii]